jgi:hypothetical protein
VASTDWWVDGHIVSALATGAQGGSSQNSATGKKRRAKQEVEQGKQQPLPVGDDSVEVGVLFEKEART